MKTIKHWLDAVLHNMGAISPQFKEKKKDWSQPSMTFIPVLNILIAFLYKSLEVNVYALHVIIMIVLLSFLKT